MPKALSRVGRKSARRLEKHFRDVQDFEFTISGRQIFMLQTRNGKRHRSPAVRFAVRMAKRKADRLEDRPFAPRPADQLDQVLAPVFDRKAVSSCEDYC